MAQLVIRDIPEALVLALKERAAANGRSAEAELPRPPAGSRANRSNSSARIATPDDDRRRRLNGGETTN